VASSGGDEQDMVADLAAIFFVSEKEVGAIQKRHVRGAFTLRQGWP
jgi:hypothetical protein